jgi:hypothetical protein
MLYYRTHASRTGERPPELVGWESPSVDAQLNENIAGDYRVLGICPPFGFAPPTTGWLPLANGWEIASVGDFSPVAHAKKSSSFRCIPYMVEGVHWLLPSVLTEEGTRNFKVRYCGPDFAPTLTTEQSAALVIANEIRVAVNSGTMPEPSICATWAADLLMLTHCLSRVSIGIVGLHEDLIDKTLRVAGGCDADPD